MKKASRPQRPLLYATSLNSVPNGQVCVFDGTYYKMMLNDVGVHDTACGWMDEWKKLHDKRPRCPLLYVISNIAPTYLRASTAVLSM
jgi:hypothetical protein